MCNKLLCDFYFYDLQIFWLWMKCSLCTSFSKCLFFSHKFSSNGGKITFYAVNVHTVNVSLYGSNCQCNPILVSCYSFSAVVIEETLARSPTLWQRRVVWENSNCHFNKAWTRTLLFHSWTNWIREKTDICTFDHIMAFIFVSRNTFQVSYFALACSPLFPYI